MFERITKVFTKASPPSQLLAGALAPVKASSDELYARCVAYVHDGSGPDLLLELASAPVQDLHELLMAPGQLLQWFWPSQPNQAKLDKLKMGKNRVREARSAYYESTLPSVAELVRFGRLLAVIGSGPNRTAAGVPDWLVALTNDVAATADHVITNGLAHRKRWTADLLASLLAHEGADPVSVPRTVLRVCFQTTADAYGLRFQPAFFPGLDEFLVVHGATFVPADLSGLLAAGKVLLCERAEKSPDVARALSALLGYLAVDSAKGVRTAALNALAGLPVETQGTAFAAPLLTASVANAHEVVELLSRTDDGAQILAQAVGAGAKISTLVARADARRETLHGADTADTPLTLPPFTPIPAPRLGDQTAEEVRRLLAREIARSEGHSETWAQQNVKRARSITEQDIASFVAIANGEGRATTTSGLLRTYNLWFLSQGCPSLTLIHAIRLEQHQQHPNVQWTIRMFVDPDTDLRAIDAAIASSGATVDLSSYVSSGYTTPEASWPWMSQHLDILQRWLTASAESAGPALRVLIAFPSIPSSLLPSVAAVALSDSRTNRPLAQDVLKGHPAERGLAEQGLVDSRSEVRAAAARWLGRIGDPAAVPALRAASKKEKREVVVAALLAAREALGDDISEALSPGVLLTEATKGLGAKPPTSMSWLSVDALPAARWADGTPVDPRILSWWVVLAVKLKDPDGSGLIDRYLSLLDPEDAAALGSHVLRAWIAQDTKHHPEEESRTYAATEGPDRWRRNQDWLARVRKNPQWANATASAEAAAAVSVEEHTARAFADHQAIYLTSATADKGMLALTTRMPGIALANAAQAYIRQHGGRRSQVETLVHALYGNADPAAIQLLLSISRRHKQVTVQATARDLVEKLAEVRGWTADELADRTIPTADFGDDRMLHLDFGDREFIGRLNAKAAIELFDADGKALKALPAPRQSDDPELVAAAKKQLTSARKEAKAVLDLQTSRLYEAMCVSRTWVGADWTEYLASHPLVSQLVSRLIWCEPGETTRTFRPTEDGELLDVDDQPVELAPDARIAVAHRVLMPAADVDRWKGHLDDYEVVPLFDQLANDVPDVAATTLEIEALKGHLTDTFSFRGVMGKRGYVRGAAEDAGWFSEYSKPFSSVDLTAVISFTGSFLPEENIACATRALSFRRRRKAVPVGEVPAILLAECYADYAALAALGPFDPDYEKKSEY